MLQQWQAGIVLRSELAAPDIIRYWIQVPGMESFDFKPGQFVTLDLPIHEQRNKRWRSYSIASHPDGSNVIELVIARLEGGLGSEYIFKNFTEGFEVMLRGPQGVFVLPEIVQKEIFLICTGTGIAPFRSMLHDIAGKGIEHQKIHLVYGTRTDKSLLYADEMRGFESIIPDFRYYPVLSRQDWDGHKGYVHQVYEELVNNRPDASFMLCGWRPMIDEAKARLLALGYSSKDIHVELYG